MAAGGGGSWKVAYADFVTAMMALFMVLWILGQDQEVKGSVESYYQNPWKAALSDSTGIIPVKNADVVSSRKANFEAPAAIELNTVRRINEDLVKTFIQNPEFREHRSLEVEQTSEGLLINFLDRPNQPIFHVGTNAAKFTEYGVFVFNTVAWEIARYASTEIELEGHTTANFKAVREDYNSWDVLTDRAKLAGRQLLNNGVKESQIIKVAGCSSKKPLNPKERKPDDPANNRVTILIRGANQAE